MTGKELAGRVLEGESPREILRRIARTNPPQPPMSEVDFDVEAEEEYDRPEGHFTEPEDVEWVRDQIEAGNEWGWCSAHVIATWTDPLTYRTYQGDQYLGGCSYRSKQDFMEPGGYYDDMKEEAYQDLLRNIEDTWEPPEDDEE